MQIFKKKIITEKEPMIKYRSISFCSDRSRTEDKKRRQIWSTFYVQCM